MPTYTVKAQETRIYDVTLVVEADTPEEAKEKAEDGDVIDTVKSELNETTSVRVCTLPGAIEEKVWEENVDG